MEHALKLHEAIRAKHWTGRAIAGPDPVGKIHWRITRFLRSYFPPRQEDSYVYIQAQAYWIRANAMLAELGWLHDAREHVAATADTLLDLQQADGSWVHPPIRGRVGFISTVEGAWGALGLARAAELLEDPRYLDGARLWHRFQVDNMGFQKHSSGMAANYYTHSATKIPNVSTMTLWMCAELYRVSGEEEFLQPCAGMVEFLTDAQLSTGELPYELEREHFQCFQYNTFQWIDLYFYHQITGDDAIVPVLKKLAEFLVGGVLENGACRYSCSHQVPEVNYWTATLGAALWLAERDGYVDVAGAWNRSRARMDQRRRDDGSFGFSTQNYKFLRDERSYPRQLAMILHARLLPHWMKQRDAGGPAI